MEGRCTCGALRYRLGSLPLFTHCCHCRLVPTPNRLRLAW